MKNTVITLGLLILTLILSNQAIAQSSVWAKVNDIQRTKNSLEFQTINQVMDIHINKPLSNSKQSHLQKVYEFSCDCDVVDLYVEMSKIPGLKGIEYGPVYENLNEPNDYSTFTNYNTNPQLESNWHLELISAQFAWGFTHGTTPIAISDQNIFSNHEDIQNKLIHYDTTNTSSSGHGTAVATLAAGSTNNGVGVASIGYDSEIAFYRMNYNDVLLASQHGHKVINLSWTSGCNYNQYIQDAINEVYNNGTFIVAAAGNGSTCGGSIEFC